jgi:hypothetical protein
MIDPECEKWHDVIAMHVFGDLSVAETTALQAHLDGCGDCEVVAREMAETIALLKFVDSSAMQSTASVSPELTNRVLGDLRGASATQRRRRRVSAVSLGTIGLVAAALILAFVLSSNAPTTTLTERTLALQGTKSVTANATLIERTWGTSLELHEQGLPGGQVYTVSMETSAGKWWTAGTYRSTGGKPISATMACAVSLHQITGIRVVNGSGVTVLSSYLSASSSSYE